MSANDCPAPLCPERCGADTFYIRDLTWPSDMHRCRCGTFFRWNGAAWQKCSFDGTFPSPPPAEDASRSFARDFREREDHQNRT